MTVVEERAERKRAVEKRLVEAGVSLGTIDAFEAAVRALEVAVVAEHMRAVAGLPGYSMGQLPPDAVRQIAGEVERFRS